MAGSATITQQAGSVPAKPGVITPASNVTSFCNGSYTFNIAAVPNALSYLWTSATGASVITNDPSAVLSFPAGFISGTIKVQAVNNCGKSQASSLKVNGLTKPAGINGPAEVTKFQSGLVYQVPNFDPTVTYVWTVPANVVIESGQNTPTLTVTWRKTSGTLKVATQNNCNQVSANISKDITVVTSAFAVDSKLDVTGKSEVEINVSPNPTNGKAWISFTAHAKENYSIAVRDVYGKLLLYKDGTTIEGKNQAEIDLGNKPNAVYFVTLVNKEIGEKTMKLVKTK